MNEQPTIEWLIEELAPNEGNSPLVNFNKKRLLNLIEIERLGAVIKERRAAYKAITQLPGLYNAVTDVLQEELDNLRKQGHEIPPSRTKR